MELVIDGLEKNIIILQLQKDSKLYSNNQNDYVPLDIIKYLL